ncbi:hypothetical protein N9Z70_05245, partial [Mariniblastus sp.]|nr:hypothetical protein [Mariniblastus sp.]
MSSKSLIRSSGLAISETRTLNQEGFAFLAETIGFAFAVASGFEPWWDNPSKKLFFNQVTLPNFSEIPTIG